MTSLPLPAATANLAALDDRGIRREVKHRKGWYFASSVDHGPAHIVGDNPYNTLCGAPPRNGSYFAAKKMCGRCRRIFLLRFERGALP